MMFQPPVVLVLVVLFASSACSVQAIYCGKERCYDVLGVKDSANATEIKKKYYKMSLQLHPDKNPDPAAKAQFQRVAQAYEVLSDPRSRKNYDYALAHPEETLYNEYQYYNSKFSMYWKTDPKAVIFGFLAVISLVQYTSRLANYRQAMSKIRQTPRYLNRKAQLVAEMDLTRSSSSSLLAPSKLKKRGSTKGKRNGGAALSPEVELQLQEQLDAEIGVFVGGYGEPSVWNTLILQLPCIPVWLAKHIYWLARWEWDYKVKKKPYKHEDAVYLTKTALRLGAGVFDGLTPAWQQELVEAALWVPQNAIQFSKDVKRGKRKMPKMVSLEGSTFTGDAWSEMTE